MAIQPTYPKPALGPRHVNLSHDARQYLQALGREWGASAMDAIQADAERIARERHLYTAGVTHVDKAIRRYRARQRGGVQRAPKTRKLTIPVWWCEHGPDQRHAWEPIPPHPRRGGWRYHCPICGGKSRCEQSDVL